jgi:hypothetical protein
VETTGELLLPWHLEVVVARRCSHAAASPRRIRHGDATVPQDGLCQHKLK